MQAATDAQRPSTARTFFDLPEAVVVTAWLRATGGRAELLDYHTSSLNWFYIPALGGLRLTADSSLDAALLEPASEPEVRTDEDLAHLDRSRKRRRLLASVALFLMMPRLALPLLLLQRLPGVAGVESD